MKSKAKDNSGPKGLAGGYDIQVSGINENIQHTAIVIMIASFIIN
jgi:hypothetical protein